MRKIVPTARRLHAHWKLAFVERSDGRICMVVFGAWEIKELPEDGPPHGWRTQCEEKMSNKDGLWTTKTVATCVACLTRGVEPLKPD